MIEFEINSHKYKTAKLNVMTQWAIARRIAPVVVKVMTPELLKNLASVFNKAKVIDSETGQPVLNVDEILNVVSGVFSPFVEALSQMSDEDSEYVINHCLSVTYRYNGGGWSIVKPSNSNIMFEDIDMLEMMQIVIRVIIDTVGNFSLASLSSLAAPEAK
jgi:hypothetical protein